MGNTSPSFCPQGAFHLSASAKMNLNVTVSRLELDGTASEVQVEPSHPKEEEIKARDISRGPPSDTREGRKPPFVTQNTHAVRAERLWCELYLLSRPGLSLF